jgi:hypothetical protein
MPSRCAVAKVAPARRRLSANFEIAQRLVQVQGQPEPGGQRPDLFG